jgi:sarcosine oxidase
MMKLSRREMMKLLGAAAIAPPTLAGGPRSRVASHAHVVVVGAGVFGAWSAHWLHKAGLRVLLLDAYGPANSRSSSGGESRIIRAAYGGDDFYSAWVKRSLPHWVALSDRAGGSLFRGTGVLTFTDDSTTLVERSADSLKRLQMPYQLLSADDLSRRFPQIAVRGGERAILEPNSGALMARRAVQTLVEELVSQGVEYRVASVTAPAGRGRITSVQTSSGETIAADTFVFACGPWLPKVFPQLLGNTIRPERGEVYFLGVPSADSSFSPPRMPTWIHKSRRWDAYGMPDLEGRGFKVAVDVISRPADPDAMDRRPSADYASNVREFVRERFPALKDAPVLETRVCQYENSVTGNYIIDRHPEMDNVWIVGGGSGHGFKNGPAVGEYVAGLLTRGLPLEKLLTLENQKPQEHRVD